MSTARSPPARPHIGIHPASIFEATDWGEDDAWDSGSDSESPRQSTLTMTWNRPSTSTSTGPTAPKPVPRPALKDSSSTLAFSYTHLNAPNPSSYPPRETDPQAPQNGWTIVRKKQKGAQGSVEELGSVNPARASESDQEGPGDVDLEGDMVVGDLEEAESSSSTAPDQASSSIPGRSKPKTDYQGSIRDDVDEIVNGTVLLYSAWCSRPTFPLNHQFLYRSAICYSSKLTAVGRISYDAAAERYVFWE